MRSKRKTLIIIISALILICLNISAFAANNTEDLMFQFGMLYKEKAENKVVDKDASIYSGKIVVDEKEVEQIAKEYELIGEKDAYRIATEFIKKREALYLEATSLGYSVSDDEIQAIIEQEIIKTIESDNYDEVAEFFKGANMTVEEYWRNCFDRIKKDTIIADYVNDLKRELFDSSNGLVESHELKDKTDIMLKNKIDNLINKYQ